ncbi:flavin reductase family protein [Catenulispora yoronensis]|uniref:Flavin reductase family protein n=1 Tax=Catenulispora yoronensis TaxID=450799 RepID=A0ABP5GPU3_9ACTN
MALFATNQDLSPAGLREVFGAFPSGVVSVVAFVDDRPIGLAASSFTSVSLDPPLVSVSIANGSKTWPELRGADHLGITVLADHHRGFARQLAGPVGARFEGIPLARTAEGAGFVEDGLAHFATSVHREVEAGDHTIVLLRVHARAAAAEGSPLVFHRSGFRTLAA